VLSLKVLPQEERGEKRGKGGGNTMQKWVPRRHLASGFQCCAQFYIVFM